MGIKPSYWQLWIDRLIVSEREWTSTSYFNVIQDAKVRSEVLIQTLVVSLVNEKWFIFAIAVTPRAITIEIIAVVTIWSIMITFNIMQIKTRWKKSQKIVLVLSFSEQQPSWKPSGKVKINLHKSATISTLFSRNVLFYTD